MSVLSEKISLLKSNAEILKQAFEMPEKN